MKQWISYFNPLEVRLFLTILLASAYFNEIDYQTGNFGRSYALTRSLGDQFSLHIDRYVGITVLDHSFYHGHYYCPVNFGASVIMLPQYLVCKTLLYYPLRLISSEAFTQLFIAWITLLSSMSIYYALSFVLMLRIINHINGYHTQNALFLIILYFGTILFPLSTIGFIENFGLIGLIGILYFMLVRTDRPRYLIVSGMFMLLSLQTYYQSILLIIPMTIYLIYEKRPYRWTWLGFSLLGVVLILLFNWIVFDGPLDFPENHWIGWNDPNFKVTDLGKDNSLSRIFNPFFIMNLLFSPRYGLIIFMPILVLIIPAAFRFHRTNKPVSMLCGLSLIAFFLFILYLGKMAVRGIGSNFGFRYIVPFMPFIMIILAGGSSKIKLKPWQIIAIVSSLIINTAGALTDPHISPDIPNPLIDHTLRLIFSQGFETFISHFLRNCIGFNSLLLNYIQIIPLILIIMLVWKNELHQWRLSLRSGSSFKSEL